jgi:putative ABC transport system permease protein
MGNFWQDVKYGTRMLVKSPGFTLVAALTLALGIGANSAIFSVVNAVLLRPLPYPDAEKLVFLTEWSEQVPNMSFSVANFSDVRDQNNVFESIVASRSQSYVLTGADEPERLNGRQVTAGFFPTFRIRPLIGREFTAEEDKPGGERVALLGEGMWTRRFARDPGVVGKALMLNGESFTVIGVLPATMHGTWRTFDVWTSLGRLEDQIGGANNRGNHPGIYVVGRRKSGVTVEQARANVVAIAKRLAEEYPNNNARQSMTVAPLLDAVVGDLGSILPLLLGAVGFVLLIACANVANLLLARAATRQREIAVRTALGARRTRVIRQLLTESVLLAFAGGVLGIGLAYGGVQGLIAISPANTPRINEVTVDGAVLGFTLLVSLLTGLIFGLAPALQASRPDVAETLKEGGRSGGGGVGRHRVRSGLVIAEVSLALVLLVGAGLMLKSFLRVLDADPGFHSENVLTMTVALPQMKYPDAEKRRAFYRQALEKVRVLPGVEAAAITLPLLGGWQTSFAIEGEPPPPPGQAPSTDITRVSPDYFRAMGVRLIKGRHFTEQDQDGQQPVCIVDEKMVQAHWPGADPLGKRMRLGAGPNNNNPWMTVVGVVAHVKNYGVDQDSRVETYVPYPQNPVGSLTFVLKTAADPGSLTSAVRGAVRSVDAELPVFGARALEEIISDGRAQRRIAAQLLATFSGLALLLAAVGIYGVMSYSVTQRAHEIGIRMALGAQKRDVLRLIVGHGMTLAGIGLTVGLALALGLAFSLRGALTTMLFRVSHTDPPTYASVPLLLAAVALLACYIPARRALRVDPMVALRYE